MYTYCCKILGVRPVSEMAEIKRAFRQKAKLLHPDLNPSPDTQSEFIRVKKAFDYITRFHGVFTSHLQVYESAGYRKDPYYHSSAFSRDRYRRMSAQHFHNRVKHKENFDFRTTVFGKVVYYFFHLIFLFAGIYITAGPMISVLKDGIDPEKSAVATLFVAFCASLFGIMMIVMIILSGLSIDVHLKFFSAGYRFRLRL